MDTASKYTNKQKKKIAHDRVMAANYLHHEQGMSEQRIKQQLKMSAPVLDRVLLATFKEWRELWKKNEGSA